MIILNLQKNKSNFEIELENYEKLLNYGNLECPHCHSNDYIRWGFYERNVIFISNNQLCSKLLKIQRIRCKGCHKTHALMPDKIIPYKQFNLKVIIDSLISYIKDKKALYNINIDYLKKLWKDFKCYCLTFIKTTFKNQKITTILYYIKTKIEYRKIYLNQNKKYFMQIKFLWINYAP